MAGLIGLARQGHFEQGRERGLLAHRRRRGALRLSKHCSRPRPRAGLRRHRPALARSGATRNTAIYHSNEGGSKHDYQRTQIGRPPPLRPFGGARPGTAHGADRGIGQGRHPAVHLRQRGRHPLQGFRAFRRAGGREDRRRGRGADLRFCHHARLVRRHGRGPRRRGRHDLDLLRLAPALLPGRRLLSHPRRPVAPDRDGCQVLRSDRAGAGGQRPRQHLQLELLL